MRRVFVCLVALPMIVVSAPLLAQTPKPAAPPAPPPVAPVKPYKMVAVKLPAPFKDAAFEALRKQIAEAAAKKDRAALAKLVVDQGFFWYRETGDAADKSKPGIDSLSNALALANKDGVGWDMLNGYSQEPTASIAMDNKNAMCAPGDPSFNDKELQDAINATGTDPSDWAYTLRPNVEVRATAQSGSAVVEKLGLQFIRILPETDSHSGSALKIATPAGKTGYVPGEAVAPLGNDQICYVKDGANWKIGGYIGGGESQ
jgi:hypothetical protein